MLSTALHNAFRSFLGLIYVCFSLFLVAQLTKIFMVLKSSVPANYLLRWFCGQNIFKKKKKALTSLCRVKLEKLSTKRMPLNNRAPKGDWSVVKNA